MILSNKVGAIFGVLAILVTSALAAGEVTGTWHGHIKIDQTKLKPAPSPQIQAKMGDWIKKTLRETVTLTLKANHTFVITSADGTKTKTVNGTWVQSGAKVSLLATMNGKPARTPIVFTVSKDGKSFVSTQGASTTTFTK